MICWQRQSRKEVRAQPSVRSGEGCRFANGPGKMAGERGLWDFVGRHNLPLRGPAGASRVVNSAYCNRRV